MLTTAAIAMPRALRKRNPEWSSQNTAKPGSAWQKPQNAAKNCGSETGNNRRASERTRKIAVKWVAKKLSPPKIAGVGSRGSVADVRYAQAGIPEKRAFDIEMVEGQPGEGGKRHGGREQRRGRRPDRLPAANSAAAGAQIAFR